jgi:hypothetical protein
MKGKLVNEYSKQNKNGKMQTNYVYAVTGNDAEIAAFLDSESAKTVADKDGNGVKAGTNLWITSRYEGENVSLVISKANRVAVDRSEERKLIALASRFGTAGNSIIADYISKQMRKSGTESVNVDSKSAVDQLDLD